MPVHGCPNIINGIIQTVSNGVEEFPQSLIYASRFTGTIFIEQYNAYFCLFSVQRLSHEHKPINISKYIIAFRCCLFVSREDDVEITFGIFRSEDFFGLNPSLNCN